MRLLTRSDFDGVVCAVLLAEKGVMDRYEFTHPKDIQDGKIPVTKDDVLANVPYAPGCGLWFDHHASEFERLDADTKFEGVSCEAPSTAQVIWDYYGGDAAFDKRFLPLLDAVNRSDSGNVTRDEVLNPKGWILLSFIIDPRTGLGRFHDYRISNLNLMKDMILYCREKSAEEILAVSDVQERVRRYIEEQELFRAMLLKHCRAEGNVIVTDLRECETIHAGNRFYVYALFPDQNIEARVMWGRQKQNVAITCGHSILNRTGKTDVGRLMLKYGGGGHTKVGTCQVPADDAERVLAEIVGKMRADG